MAVRQGKRNNKKGGTRHTYLNFTTLNVYRYPLIVVTALSIQYQRGMLANHKYLIAQTSSDTNTP